MGGSDYVYYVGNEIKYGTKLYISGWKKLLFHPWQMIKDTANAILHPIETIKNVLNEIKHHPIGMAVNIGLSWITGRAITASVKYLRTAPLQTPQFITESPFSSVFSQAAQVGSQILGRGCCSGGFCATTAGRIGQTTSLVSSQSTSASDHRTMISPQTETQLASNDFIPHFNGSKKVNKKGNVAETKQTIEDQLTYQKAKLH